MKKNILYFSLVDWKWIKQRPHHFSEILSLSNNVVYLFVGSFRKFTNRNQVFGLENLMIAEKKLFPKESLFRLISRINSVIMKKYLRTLDNTHKFEVIMLTHPSQVKYIPDYFFKSKKVVYDCMDDYNSFPGMYNKDFESLEKYLIDNSKLVVTSSETIRSKLMKKDAFNSSNIVVINNGVDKDNFKVLSVNQIRLLEYINYNKLKKVAYIGTISEWVDLDLIYYSASKHKDVEYYVVGPIDPKVKISQYTSSNIYFTGAVPYEDVTHILNSIDVAIMPFKNVELVRSVNPVKIYEYLACGKEVIANRYEEMEKFKDYVKLYTTYDEFEEFLDNALKGSNSIIIEKGLQFASENTWKMRVAKLEELIESI